MHAMRCYLNILREADMDDFMYGGFDDTLHEYLHGSCWTFAVAVHRKTGWPLAWLLGPMPIHGFVVHPDGRYVDAAGFGDHKAYRRRYGAPRSIKTEVKDASEEHFDFFAGLDEDEIDMAAEFMKHLKQPPFPLS